MSEHALGADPGAIPPPAARRDAAALHLATRWEAAP